MPHSRKYPYPPQKGYFEFPGGGGGGSVRPICLRCVKLNTWNFQRGGEGGGRKKTLPWGGMDIYWKYATKLVWNRLGHCS